VTSLRAASEPLLWLQLLGAALLPLEALLVLLLLAGSDPGPLPSLERLLCWSLGGLAPALLLWRKPADVWSLLLVQTPPRGRRDLQRRLSTLQETLPLKVALAIGSALLLVLLWRLDGAAALASALAPLPDAPRLVDLLLSAPLLALMLWQWQQLLQSLWLLSRSSAAVAAAAPLGAAALAERRLSLGLPLLLPKPLALDRATFSDTSAPQAAAMPPEPEPEPEPHAERVSSRGEAGEPMEVMVESMDPWEAADAATLKPTKARSGAGEIVDVEAESLESQSTTHTGNQPAETSDITGAVAVEPEQAAEQADGPDLDEPVA
jgi:hypothetical protein